jgi:phage shock protein E
MLLLAPGTTKAFVPSAPFMRGSTTRLASNWFHPQLHRGAVIPTYQPHSRGFLNMNFISDMFYELRSNSLGFASKDEVKAAAAKPNAVFLDVRGEAEIAAASLNVGKPVILATCTSVDDCPALNQLPKDKDTPVIVFCASGKRASNAQQVLESKGYSNVLNAGGLSDLDYL